MPQMPLLSDLATTLRQMSQQYWLDKATLLLIGRHPHFVRAQRKMEKFARLDRPVIVTGETGVGKEAFARSLYLLSARRGKPYTTVNCAQSRDDNLIVSELFGHTKGSFTGATTDRPGVFEEADGGVLFLDEVGELTPRAQAMLLRALSEGEIRPLGATRSRRVDVRVIAATNRDLPAMVRKGTFREDLYYRLRYLQLHVPPVRERGTDWRLIAGYYLERHNRRHKCRKTLSPTTTALLDAYAWPGNVREVIGMVDVGFCLAEGETIEPDDVREGMQRAAEHGPSATVAARAADCLAAMADGSATFWEVVHAPFLDRDLNRAEVRAVVREGLAQSQGSYKQLLPRFGIVEADYLKFMDFLRHHRLKPTRRVAA